MGVKHSLRTQQPAFIGVGFCELVAIDFGRLDHFGSGRPQQISVGWVCNGFLLHVEVHHHASQFSVGDQLEGIGHYPCLALALGT